MLLSHKTPPGPKGLPFLGSLLDMRRDIIKLLMDSTRDYGGIVKLKLGYDLAFLVSEPEFLKYVYLDHHKNFTKQTKAWKLFRLIFGEGLLTSEGELWRQQRRLMQPSFHRERIASLVKVMVNASAEMLKTWEEKNQVDVSAEMMRLTLRIVGETLLGINMSDQADVVAKTLPILLDQTIHQITKVVGLPLSFPSPRNLRFRKALKDMRGIGAKVIEERRHHPEKNADLLSMLMEARDEETGEKMSEEQLLDEVMTLFLAGHETTANALTWTCYLLSQHPDVEKKVREEVEHILRGHSPRFEDLPKLSYLERVIKESLRLYPPVWFMGRLVMEDDEIGGYFVPAKSMIFLSPYITHHSRHLWEEPERFDPDRFLPERFSQKHRFAYTPFGAGPRQCIGNGFALMEAQVILAMMLQKYRFQLVPGHRVEMDPIITLRAKYGMKMNLEKRGGSFIHC